MHLIGLGEDSKTELQMCFKQQKYWDMWVASQGEDLVGYTTYSDA